MHWIIISSYCIWSHNTPDPVQILTAGTAGKGGHTAWSSPLLALQWESSPIVLVNRQRSHNGFCIHSALMSCPQPSGPHRNYHIQISHRDNKSISVSENALHKKWERTAKRSVRSLVIVLVNENLKRATDLKWSNIENRGRRWQVVIIGEICTGEKSLEFGINGSTHAHTPWSRSSPAHTLTVIQL